MHHCVGATIGERSLDLVALRKVALDKSRPPIDCAAMAFAQIVKDRDFVAFIEQLFRANAADVTRAANKENFHPPGNRGPPRRVESKRGTFGRSLRDGFALLFLKSCNHLPRATMLGTRREDFQTLFLR